MKKIAFLVLSVSLLSAPTARAQDVCANVNARIQALLKDEAVFEQSAGKGFTMDQSNAQRNSLDRQRDQLLQCLSPESRQKLLDSITQVRMASKGSIARQSTSEQVHRRALSMTKEYRPLTPHDRAPDPLINRKIYQK